MNISFTNPNKPERIRRKLDGLQYFSDSEMLLLFKDAILNAPIRAQGIAPNPNTFQDRPAIIRWGWNEELQGIISVKLCADAWDKGEALVNTSQTHPTCLLYTSPSPRDS